MNCEQKSFDESTIQCTICNNIFSESMVNIIDQEDDVCTYCETKNND